MPLGRDVPMAVDVPMLADVAAFVAPQEIEKRKKGGAAAEGVRAAEARAELLAEQGGPAEAVRRDEAVIATKWGYTFDEASRQATGEDASPAYLRSAVIASLRLKGVRPIVAADFSLRRRELAAAVGADIAADHREHRALRIDAVHREIAASASSSCAEPGSRARPRRAGRRTRRAGSRGAG